MCAIFLSGPVDLLPVRIFIDIFKSAAKINFFGVWFLNIWIYAILTSRLQEPYHNETTVTSFANVHLLS